MTKQSEQFDWMTKSAATYDFSPQPTAFCTVQGCGPAAKESVYQPCDVDFLEIGNRADEKASAKVRCTQPAGWDGTLNAEQKKLLGSDDLLLQTVADFHRDGSYDPSKMTEALIILSGTTSPDCPTSAHRRLTWLPVSNAPDDAVPQIWVGNMSAPAQKMLAQSTRAQVGGFLERFWPFGMSDTVVYRTEISSCGVRDGATPKRELSGRVEVLPDVKYKLSLKIPSFYTMKREREGEYDLKTGTQTTSVERSTSSNFGRDATSQTSSTEERKGKKGEDEISGFSFDTEETSVRESGGDTYRTSSREGTKKGEAYLSETESVMTHGWVLDKELSYTDSTDKDAALKEEIKSGTNITLTRNGQEIDIVKSIENIIKIVKDIQKAWDNFEKAVPKVGWQASLEIEIFTGTFTGEWGIRPKKAATHARIWETERYFKFDIAIKVFYLKVDIGFGFEFIVENWFSSHPLLEIIAKITGAVSVDVSLSAAVEWNRKDTLESKLSAKPLASLVGVARASAIGYTFNASCSIEAGIEFSGAFKVDFDYSPTCDAKLEWVPITVTVDLEYPGLEPRQHIWKWPKTELEPIWEGPIFGEPAPNGRS